MVETVPRDKEYPDASLVIFEVAGDSMNNLTPYPILPGVRVIALDYSDPRGRLALRDGMVVVVEQFTHDGSLRELSAKQIELYDDRIEFCPARSTRGTGQSPCQETAAPNGRAKCGWWRSCAKFRARVPLR